jgi:hypothetical protein
MSADAPDLTVPAPPKKAADADPGSQPQATAPAKANRLDGRAVALAGIASGAVFLLLGLSTQLLGTTVPLELMRATLTNLVGIDPAQATGLQLGGIFAAHFGLTIGATALLALGVRRVVPHISIAVGMVYGGLLYTANRVLLAAIVPSVGLSDDLFVIGNYIIFGGLAAYLYKTLQR